LVVVGSRRKHLGLDSSNISRAPNAMSKILVAASNNRADTAAFALAYPDFAIKIVAVHDGQVLHKGTHRVLGRFWSYTTSNVSDKSSSAFWVCYIEVTFHVLLAGAIWLLKRRPAYICEGEPSGSHRREKHTTRNKTVFAFWQMSENAILKLFGTSKKLLNCSKFKIGKCRIRTGGMSGETSHPNDFHVSAPEKRIQ
jgi:hypothetical protein